LIAICKQSIAGRRFAAIGARHGPCNLPGMNLEYGIGLALAALLTAYLVYALLKPESF
jgi:K+-transporting ATPase KdpF subunit